MMSAVCKNTEIEPELTPLSGRELNSRISNISNDAGVEIRRNRGFREQRQQTFFILMVFNPNACRCHNKSR